MEGKNEEEIISRRRRLNENPRVRILISDIKEHIKLNDDFQLREVFSMFWILLMMDSVDGEVLYKDQFVNFLLLLQTALLGQQHVDTEETALYAENEYIQNIGYYGEITEFAFMDIMAECIGMLNKSYHNVVTVFLLQSVGQMWKIRGFTQRLLGISFVLLSIRVNAFQCLTIFQISTKYCQERTLKW